MTSTLPRLVFRSLFVLLLVSGATLVLAFPPSRAVESEDARKADSSGDRNADRSRSDGAEAATPDETVTLAETDRLRWYRGNMHTHSLWSDGDNYLEAIAKWYREHDYQFLVFTDHNVLADRERWIDVEKNKGGRDAFEKLKQAFPDWVETRTEGDRLQVRLRRYEEVAERFDQPGEFLLIQGEEITDRYRNLPVHMNATNLAEAVPPMHGESVVEVMQNNVNEVIKQRERTGRSILIHLNHPNYGYGVSGDDLAVIRGENFFEVYNGHSGVNDSGNAEHGSTDRIWDRVNTLRLTKLGLPMMFGLATDDCHNYHEVPSPGRRSEPGRGWVTVLADSLDPESLIESLEAGRFYASSGVELKRVESSPKGLAVTVAAEEGVDYTIDFLGTRAADAEQEFGVVLKSVTGPQAAYEFEGDELYVRARVTSSRKHPNASEPGEFERAWAQPVRGPAAKPAE